MLQPLLFFLMLLMEMVLLLIILIFLIVGTLGIFLPVLPGILIIGAAVAIYSLMVRNEKGALAPHVHRRVLRVGAFLSNLSIIKKTMALLDNIKKRRSEEVEETIIKYGMILFGFNLALILAVSLTFSMLTVLVQMFNVGLAAIIFVPLFIIFLFAGISGVIWYRFGQIIGEKFKKRKVINSSFVVLISILPVLALLFVLSSIFALVNGFRNELLALLFIGLVFMSVLASVFELFVVSLGTLTKR